MKLTVLGCGTSSGVPRIGNDWGACDPAEPRNRRTRVSVLVEADGQRVLVDTGPDLREQLLAARVGEVDLVIWTHDHADHCNGIDDLRQIYHRLRHPVRGMARRGTGQALLSRFGYVFHGRAGYPPTATLEPLPDALTLGALTIRVVDQPHGPITTTGLRFEHRGKAIVYATDFSALTPAMHTLYEGADVWIVDALRRAPHPTHPHVDQVLAWTRELGIGRAVLTHMDWSMDYATLLAELPCGVEPGFDGLEIVT